MKSSARLDSVVFQLTPTRTRCDLVISANGKTEKMASGLLNPFLAHLKTAQVQMSQGGYSIILQPESAIDASWFTKGTVERFIILFLSGIVEDHRVKLVESTGTGGSRATPDSNGEKAIVLYSPSALRSEVNASSVEGNSKAQLWKVLETRKTVLQKEQSMAFAGAVAAGFDIDHMVPLISFAETFGASRFRDGCIKFTELWKRKQETGQWLEIEAAEAMSSRSDFPAMNAAGIVFSEYNGKSGVESSTDEKPSMDQQTPGRQESYQSQYLHPLFPPWPIHSPPGGLPPFQGYPMQGMPEEDVEDGDTEHKYSRRYSKANGSRTKSVDAYDREETVNGKETDGGHWQAFQNYLLRDAEDEECRTDQEMFSTGKEVQGMRRPSQVHGSEDPLVFWVREMSQFEEGNATDMHETSASGSRLPKASNDQSLTIGRGGHPADGGRIFIDGEMDGRSACRRTINDEFILDRQHNLSDFTNSPSDPQAINRLERSSNGLERSSNDINDYSYIVPFRSTSVTLVGTDDRSGINMDSDFSLSLLKAENIPNRLGNHANYEPDGLSLMPERGGEMGSIGYDPALDYEMQVRVKDGTSLVKKNKEGMQGSKKSQKDRKSKLIADPSDKKKAVRPIRRAKPSKPSPLDEAKVRAERLRASKADLQKIKKEKEEAEIKRLEALKLERQKRVAARGGSVPVQSSVATQSRKQLPSKLSPSSHKTSKFTDGTPSHGNRLSQPVSSLPELKNIGSVTPDTKVSMARIRRLSEPKTSSSPLVSSVKSRNYDPSKKTKVSGAPERKNISAIVNHDKSKIASLPELKIKTTKAPDVTSSKSGGTESISLTADANEPSRNKEKVSLHTDGDYNTVVEKTVVLLESIPAVNSSEGTTIVQKENNGIFKNRGETEVVSDYAAIHAPVSSLNLEAFGKEHQVQKGNVSNTEKELSKFTSTSVTENQYQAPLARVSSLEDPCTGISEYDRAPPASMQAATTDSENVRALVVDTNNLKLEKIPEVLDNHQVKESSKGFRRLLKFGKKNHSSARSEHSVDSNSEAEELGVNTASYREVHTLKNLISQDETLTAGNTPQKSSRSFSLLSPFRSKTSEKKYMA
ncbi:hypothetical protein GQ457_12G004340 [Hibiscus cannabinus]